MGTADSLQVRVPDPALGQKSSLSCCLFCALALDEGYIFQNIRRIWIHGSRQRGNGIGVSCKGKETKDKLSIFFLSF